MLERSFDEERLVNEYVSIFKEHWALKGIEQARMNE